MKRNFIFTTLAVCAPVLIGSKLIAAELDNRLYVAPALTYIIADDDRQADNALGLQLGIGKALNQSWNIEASFNGDSLDLKNVSGEFKQRGLAVDGLYFLTRENNFSSYAVIGAGALRTTYLGSRSSNAMVNVGAGVMRSLNTLGMSVRGDLRYRIDADDSSVAGQDRFGDWVVAVGLAIPIGAKAVIAAAPVVVAPAPAKVIAVVDSDGDRVTDKEDRCPDTPPGVIVDEKGCEVDSDRDGVVDSADRCPTTSAGSKVDAKGCEADSDSDGVVDSKDSCPNTPHGMRVNDKGCEMDRDSDGIVDSQDKCPDSRVNAKVAQDGCEAAEVIVLKDVRFETNSDSLTGSSIKILDEVAATLIQRPNISIEVAGYTDDRGAAAHNETLSQKRAEAVAKYLIDRGVDASKLSAKGYGSADPVAENNTSEGRAQNRRVELHIQQ